VGFLDKLAEILGRKPTPAVQGCPLQKAIICICVCREDTDKGVPGLNVALQGPTPGQAVTDENGVSEFQDRTPGAYKYDVSFPPPKFKDWHVVPYGKDVSVAGGQVAIRDVVAYPFGHLVVEIRDELKNSALIPHLAAITGASAVGSLQKNDAKGTHTFPQVKCGKYEVSASVPIDFYERSTYSAPPVEVAEGKTVTVKLLVKGKHVAPKIDIDEPRVVIVRHDYYDKIKPPILPHRIPVKLKATAFYDGEGELTCTPADIKVYDKKDSKNPLSFPVIVKKEQISGRVVWVEAVRPSAGKEKTELKFELKRGSIPVRPAVTEKITCVKLKLDIHKSRPEGGGDPVLIADAAKIEPGRHILEQGSDDKHLFAERALLIVKKAEPHDFTGNLVLDPITAGVDLFAADKEVSASGQAALTGASLTWANSGIDAAKGKRFWVEGKKLSAKMRDTGWKVGVEQVKENGALVEGDRVTMTVLRADLELYKSRTALPAAGRPKAFSDDDKLAVGRPLHKQDPGFHHGRAMLVVKKVKPDGFTGTLTLSSWNVLHTPSYSESKAAAPRVNLYEDEVPAAGQAALAFVKEVDHPANFPAHGKEFWVEGGELSGALLDTQIRLGVKEVDKGCDRVAFSIVQFKNLKADIPSTPPNQVRAANSPVPRHTLEIGKPPASKDFDEDYGINQPLVLIEDSVTFADQVIFTVEIEPAVANDLVSWDCYRDKSTTGDHADVIAIHNTDDVDLVQDAADRLKANLVANNVGSFRICPFIDCNGSKRLDVYDASGKKRIDREPYMCLNLVLVRVNGVLNNSVAQPANAAVVPAAPTSATGCGVSTGAWAIATTGAYSKATVKVTGGGADGRRGLDSVFAGWCQQIGPTATSTSVPPGLDVYAQYQDPGPPPVLHQRFFIFTQTGVAGTVFGPPPAAAPVVEACPVLDVTPTGTDGTGGDSCTGQWGGHGSLTAIATTIKTVGEEWVVDTLDSPSVGHPAAHGSFPGTLVFFRFNIDFRVDLLFWTNITKVSTPSPDSACRLYSSVQTNNWTVRFSISFNPGTGLPIGAVPAVGIVMTKDASPTRRATPVDGLGLETRFPIALNLFSTDATA
jgi:hypothetical protein